MNDKVFKMKFADIYSLYLQKVMRKGRTQDELDTVIMWLTGYDEQGLQSQIDGGTTLEEFFAAAPQINPNSHLIIGVICGIRVENIEDSLMKKIRQMDKLVDELAKGKTLDKILRED